MKADPITTTDSAGRKITLRKPSALDKMRLFKAAGPIHSQNQIWLAHAMLAYAVTDIDGTPVIAPVNDSQIDALVGKLDDHGIEAVALALAPEQKTAEETHEEAKN